MTRAGFDVGETPIDISDGVDEGTTIIVQNVGSAAIYLVEATAFADGKPFMLRGRYYADSAEYEVGSDPIWASTRGTFESELAVSY